MLLVGTSINQAWSVSLFRLLGDGALKNKTYIKQLMVSMFFLLVITFGVLLLLQNFLFGLFASREFEPSKRYFPYLLLSFFFQSVYFLFVNFDFYEERAVIIGLTTMITALINVALNLVLISRFGVQGAVYAAVASMGLYMLLVVARVVLFNKSFRSVWLS
jgi:O-antigen/teichoic acid export membrane protein